MIKKISLLLIFSCFVLIFSGCSKTNNVIKYNIDEEVHKIIDVAPYPEELLNKKLQDELQENATNEDLALIDKNLINYELAENALPDEGMFGFDDRFYATGKIDWLGEIWTVDIFRNSSTDKLTDIRYLLSFNPNDLDYARRRIRELSDLFLKTYNHVAYQNNIFEYDIMNTEDNPIEIIVNLENVVIDYTIFVAEIEEGNKKPYIEIFFTDKRELHDIGTFDVLQKIEHLEVALRHEDVKFRTMYLSPTSGYIIKEPVTKENMSPEDAILFGGVFYKD